MTTLTADTAIPQTNKYLRWFYILIGLIAIGPIAFATLRPIQVLPRITPAPSFVLTNQAGQSLTSEDLRGSIVLYNFTYTHCQADCPQTSPTMQAVQAQLDTIENGNIPIQLVTLSFDPTRDTPATLQQYATTLGADTSQWHFATGPANQLKWIIGAGYSLFYQANPDGTYTFDPALMLVDGAGILRAEYRTATPEIDRILRDINLLISEAQNSQGAARYAYEAAHLFLCYPR